jgi:perosamine synthetase
MMARNSSVEHNHRDPEFEETGFKAGIMFNLQPNEHWDYGAIDAIRGLRVALSSRCSGEQRDIGISGLGRCRPVRSGRAAIFLALKALELPPRASIGVPLYCCPVVFKAITAAGYRARFIDVDPDTYCLSAADLAAKSSEVDAVIAVHMFGNVCDVPVLQSAAPGKPFIEDCAQALGSRLNGRLAGSFGEIAAFSFRSGKYLSVGEGGAVYCGDSDLEPQLSELINTLSVPSRGDECLHVVTTYLRSRLRTRPLWGPIGTRLWDAYNATVSYTSQSPLVVGQVYEPDRDLALRRLPLLDSWIGKQRSNARYYDQNLRVDAEMLCSETPGAFFNRLQYPLLLPTSGQCDQLVGRLRESQISTARPYKDIAAIAATHYGYTGDCPQAERIARTVLVIPCNYAIKAADVERIATCVNSAWAEVSGRQRGIGVPSVHNSATAPKHGQNVGSVVETHHSS